MNKKNCIIILLIVSILLLSIGYLKLALAKGLVSENSIKWNVHIKEIKKINSEGGAYEISLPTYTLYSAIYDVGFVNIGDSITYEVKIKNDGNIDAKLKSVVIVPQNNNIRKELENIYINEELKAGEEKVFKLKLICNNVTNYSEKETIVLGYVQK